MDDYHDRAGRFAKGNPGRPTGAKNRTNREMALQVLATVDELDEQEPYQAAGGYLRWLARKDPKTFAGLLRAVLPRDSRVEVEQAVQMTDLLDRMDQIAGEQDAQPKGRGNGGAVRLAAGR